LAAVPLAGVAETRAQQTYGLKEFEFVSRSNSASSTDASVTKGSVRRLVETTVSALLSSFLAVRRLNEFTALYNPRKRSRTDDKETLRFPCTVLVKVDGHVRAPAKTATPVSESLC